MPEHDLLLGSRRDRPERRGFAGSTRAALGRLRHASGGASAVEFALLLPVFLAFLLGIEEFGRALWTQAALQFAVEAGVRCASTSCAVDIPTYAATQALGLTVPSTAFTYTSSQSCGIAGYASGKQVTASYAFPSMVVSLRFLPQLNVTLSAKSCRP
jgi:Flp pilus assembly protein TadG